MNHRQIKNLAIIITSLTMKKTFCYLILILCIVVSCGKTQLDYTNIPRTKVLMKIPLGYKIMNANTGIQKGESEAIMIMDIVGGSFYTNARDFNKFNFEMRGIAVYEYKDTIVSGFPAKYMITNTDDKNLSGFSLVFGDSTFSTMLSSIHKAGDKQIEKTIKETLLSVKYDKSIIVKPFEGVKFILDTISTDFRFLAFSGGLYIFTTFGKDEPGDKSGIMITPSLYDKSMTLEKLSQVAQNSLEKHGMVGCLADSTSSYEVEGINAFLSVGDCYTNTDKIYFYNLVLAKKDYSLMIYAMCNYEDERMKSEISKFCKGIRIKN